MTEKKPDQVGTIKTSCSLTVLRLPPLQLPLGLEGGDDIFNQVAVGVAIAIVWQLRVTREAFLLLLVEETQTDHHSSQ